MMIEFNRGKDSYLAMGIALIFHIGIALLLIFFMNFEYPDPPLGERTVSVSFADIGQDEVAGGESESEVPSEVVENVEEPVPAEEVPQPQPEESQEPVFTQEDAPVAIPEETTQQEPEEVEPEREVDENLSNLFGKLNSSGCYFSRAISGSHLNIA